MKQIYSSLVLLAIVIISSCATQNINSKEVFSELCESGDKLSCYFLGEILISEDAEKNAKEKEKLFEKACEGGVDKACSVNQLIDRCNAMRTGKKEQAMALFACKKAFVAAFEETCGHNDTSACAIAKAVKDCETKQAQRKGGEQSLNRCDRLFWSKLGHFIKKYPIRHAGIANTLFATAKLYDNIGNYDGALQFFYAYIGYLNAFSGENIEISKESDIAKTFLAIGEVYQNKGWFLTASNYFDEAYRMLGDLVPPDHPIFAEAFSLLGENNKKMGRYLKSLDYFNKALDIYQSALPADFSNIADTLFAIGEVHIKRGEYPKGIHYFEKALKMYKAAFPVDTNIVAETLLAIGQAHISAKNYSEALSFLQQSLEIKEKILSFADSNTMRTKINMDIATSTYEMGRAHMLKENYAEALNYFEQSYEINKKPLLVIDSKETATASSTAIGRSLFATGQVYSAIGNYPFALEYFEKSLQFFRNVLPSNHPLIALSLCSTSHIYKIAGKEAETSGHEELCEKSITKADYRQYWIQGDYPEALGYLKQIYDVYTTLFPLNHPETTNILYTIGRVHWLMEDYEEAQHSLEKSHESFKHYLHSQHPSITNNLGMLGIVNFDMGKVEEGRAYSKNGLVNIESQISDAVSVLKERERIALINQKKVFLDSYLSFDDGSENTKENYDFILKWRSFSITADLSEKEAVYTKQGVAVFQEKQKLAKKYQELFDAIPKDSDVSGEMRTHIPGMKNRLSELDEKLADGDSYYKKVSALAFAKTEEICKALPDDAVLIDFVRYGRHNPAYLRAKDKNLKAQEERYAIFVLTGGENCTSPARIEIKDAAKIDSLVSDTHSLFSTKKEEKFKNREEMGKERLSVLSKEIWAPIAGKLQGKKRIYVNTDADVANFPFDILIDGSGEMLIKNFTISYLDLPQTLISIASEQKQQSKEYLAVGGVNYNEAKGNSSFHDSDKAVAPGASFGYWGPLAGASKELETVHAFLEKNEVGGEILRDEKATKQAVAESMQNKRYIYIATHSKFDGVKARAANEYSEGFSTNALNVFSEDDPMRATYLVFAGANTHRERAYLTAAEIASFDLRETELVILSNRSHTKLLTKESILAFQRAFIGAGSRALVLPLWSPDDSATLELLTIFMKEKEKISDTAEAMRQAKLKLMGREPEPFFWAPFIVVGQ
ncbi:MAG: tetratricopeptide repeat protein [bacterium]